MQTVTRVPLHRLGTLALIGGIIGLLYWPFYAAAFFATESGSDSDDPAWVNAWSDPFRDAVGPMLTFASPHDVYVTYGKAFTLVAMGYLAGLIGLHRWQTAPERRFERVAFRFALTATALFGTASLGLYYMPQPYWDRYVDVFFLGMAVPGLLLSMLAYPLFGWATVRARVAPRSVGWLLGLGAFPGIILLTELTGSLAGGLILVHTAFIVAGAAMRRTVTVPMRQAVRTTAAEGS